MALLITRLEYSTSTKIDISKPLRDAISKILIFCGLKTLYAQSEGRLEMLLH